MANNYISANILFYTSGEGDEGTFPSFLTRYISIRASRTSLEALILDWYMQRQCKGENLAHGKQILICQSLVFQGQGGGWSNFALFHNTLCTE